jgi:hypothetical protein
VTITIFLCICVYALLLTVYPKPTMVCAGVVLVLICMPTIKQFSLHQTQDLVASCAKHFWQNDSEGDCLKAQQAVAEYTGHACDYACKVMIATNGKPFANDSR